MTQLSDHDLLDRFNSLHDADALDELVRRYIGLVYSAARRQVGDAHLAEDVTQAVFIVLVRNARTIRPDTVLPAWLFTVTRHAASNAVRVRARQRHYETKKALMSPGEETTPINEATSDEIRQHLDDAIARLPSVERSGVLLHFFGNRTHRQVGEALGLSEEAARKRVSRGLEKMRILLQGRGVTAASATAIATYLSVEGAATACAAPMSLLASTVNVALLANAVGPATGSSGAMMIAQGVSKMIALTKIKVAAAACVGVLLVGGAVSPIVSHAHRSGVFAPFVTTTLVQTAVPAAPAAQSDFTVNATDKIKVEFLGVSKFPPDADSWHALNGDPIELPDDRLENLDTKLRAQPEPQHIVAVRITNAPAHSMRMKVKNSSVSAVMQHRDDEVTMLACAFDTSDANASVEIGISEVDWNTAAANENPKQEFSIDAPGLGQVSFSPIDGEGDHCQAIVTHPQIEIPNQLIVVDDAGTQYQADNINISTDGETITMTCKFPTPAEKVAKVLLQTRPYSKYVDATNISLEKGQKTEPSIKVRDAKDGK